MEKIVYYSIDKKYHERAMKLIKDKTDPKSNQSLFSSLISSPKFTNISDGILDLDE